MSTGIVDPAEVWLNKIAAQLDMIQKLEEAQESSVYRARQNLATWSEIGNALGVSKQAAQQKYGREALAGW